MNLKSEQRRLYALLPQNARCFVRVCDDDSALWVSDLPRKREDCAEMLAKLQTEGFAVRLDEKARLWYIDWTKEYWLQLLKECPKEIPAFPACEDDHEVYALARIYLLHPSAFDDGQLPVLRGVVKMMDENASRRQRRTRLLYEQAAVLMRTKQALPYAAGRILASWLAKTSTKESAT